MPRLGANQSHDGVTDASFVSRIASRQYRCQMGQREARMSPRKILEKAFKDLLLENYQRAGSEVGYWATRFLRAVRKRGGLAQARAMLRPRNLNQRAGLDRLIDAKRPELTVEASI